MIRFKYYTPEKYYEGEGSYFFVTLNPGYTCLVGPNGAGKTTMIAQLRKYCENNKKDIVVVSFDNLRSGSNRRFQKFIDNQRVDLIATIMQSSEGQGIVANLGEFASTVGNAAKEAAYYKKKLVILLDGIDSGTSIDNIYDIRKYFIDFIINQDKNGVEVYIIATVNSFAMVEEVEGLITPKCIRVMDGKYRTFRTYKGFKGFVLKSREDIDKKYNNQEE